MSKQSKQPVNHLLVAARYSAQCGLILLAENRTTTRLSGDVITATDCAYDCLVYEACSAIKQREAHCFPYKN